ncbi:uncharacterized protein LOC119688290 [Teleopsis dalmanni]|uniref:uncharacterized protein LOC119688290 n=1 Tax=Teleopsis dalmanni TaxID=139649 RepID=UPI0018CC9245|nr:uncharacterized protein LOC119688290 [Teleopsis dalmanni]
MQSCSKNTARTPINNNQKRKNHIWRRVYKKFFVSHSYYDAIQPVLFCTYVYGITSFRVARNKFGTKSIRSTWFGYINPFLRIVGFALSYVYAIYYNESLIGYFSNSYVSNLGTKLHFFFGFVGVSVVFTSSAIYKSQLLHTIDLFTKIDRHFELVNTNCNYSVILCCVLSYMGVILSLVITCMVLCLRSLYLMNVRPSPFLLYIFISEMFGIPLWITLYCLLITSLNRRIDVLNKCYNIISPGSQHPLLGGEDSKILSI